MSCKPALKVKGHGLEVIERPSSWKEDRDGALVTAAMMAVVGAITFTWGGPAVVTVLAIAGSAFCVYLAIVAHRQIHKP